MATNQRSIIDFYRDFETTGIQGARAISRSFNGKLNITDLTFEKIFKLLYPDSAALDSAEDIWKVLKELGTSTPSAEQDGSGKKNAQEITKILRIYHTSFSGDNNELSNQIRDFYVNGGRPSAYRAYKNSEKKYEIVNNPLRAIGNATVPNNKDASLKRGPSLMYILLDTPNIDIKLRNADKVSVFLNYVPSIIASQLQPYLDVEFNLSRNIASGDNNNNPRLSSMSQLKFLMGPEAIQPGSANQKIHKASLKRSDFAAQSSDDSAQRAELVKQQLIGQYAAWEVAKKQYESTVPATVKNAEGKYVTGRAQYPVPPPPNPENAKDADAVNAYIASLDSAKPSSIIAKEVLSAGIELFTMPQTLLNMDPLSNKGRFQPVINPTMPFGAITNLTIDIRPSVGVISFKTATLTLKIFDRSRLVEIADFLNPKLYQAVTLWLTYGWRAPIFPPQSRPGLANDIKIYADFINESMLRREAYGVRNVSVSTEPNGVTTVTLSLFTRGGAELLEVKDSRSGDFDKIREKIGADLEEIKALAKKFGLQSFVDVGKELRGSQVISAALAGDIIAVDSKELSTIASALKTTLQEKGFGEEAGKLESLLKQVYGKSSADGKSLLDDKLEGAAKGLARSRFYSLISEESKQSDVWTIPNEISDKSVSANDDKFAGEQADMPRPTSMQKIRASAAARKDQDLSKGSKDKSGNQVFGGFGSLSFGRLFASYFFDVARGLTDSNVVDDVQVIFYNLNSLAGPVANLNIAEFPIEMSPLEEAYAKKVAEQKGENMSFTTLLEVIKDSQFSRMQHSAYGFQSYFVPDKKTGKLVQDEKQSKQLASAVLKNYGLPGAFSLPALEFYIETSFAKSTSKLEVDLLESIDFSRRVASDGNSSNNVKKIMRIHIYDKAAIPHQAATQILSSPNGYIEVDSEVYRELQIKNRNAAINIENLQKLISNLQSKIKAINSESAAASSNDPDQNLEAFKQIAVQLDLPPEITNDSERLKSLFKVISFKEADGTPSFEKVKQQIGRFVPTITIGSNGSMIESSNYSTGNDALLSTIMMLRNSQSAANPAQPNGSGVGDLPLRIIPGSLTINSLGCPLVEYMQQFFVDLGTGTTADNLYNVTGLTHTFSPGKFATQIKFTFADAYGRYESPQSFIDGVTAELTKLQNDLEKSKKAEEEKNKQNKGAKKPSPPATQ
jgi:hypothetical protein